MVVIMDGIGVVSKNTNEPKTLVNRGISDRYLLRFDWQRKVEFVKSAPIRPCTLFVAAVAGWIQREQQAAIVYLIEEKSLQG